TAFDDTTTSSPSRQQGSLRSWMAALLSFTSWLMYATSAGVSGSDTARVVEHPSNAKKIGSSLITVATHAGRRRSLQLNTWGGRAEFGQYEVFPRISSHDLRRTFATWLRADGVAVREVAAMLGHADSRMAERVYARLPPDLLRDLLSELCQPAAGHGLPQAGNEGHRWHSAAVRRPLEEVPRGGIEPPTRGFSVPCSTD